MFRFLLLGLFTLVTLYGRAEQKQGQLISIQSDGAVRRALVYAPLSDSKGGHPLVFVFHGRGGSMHAVSTRMDLHNHWRKAIVVYPQGMWCDGGYRDGFGWVVPDGDDEGRDIRFFDALLDYIKQNYRVDEQNIYAAGHSNGGIFTNTLWALRGNLFRGFAISASWSSRLKEYAQKRGPKPVMMIGGEQDNVVPLKLVKYEIELAKQINGCTTGRRFTKATKIYKGVGGADVAVAIHPYDHKFRKEMTQEIVTFFRYLSKRKE